MKINTNPARLSTGKMSVLALILLTSLSIGTVTGVEISSLPVYQPEKIKVNEDWLIKPVKTESEVFRTSNENEIVMSNGLISRTFRITPNAATVDFANLTSGVSVLRGVKPEASVTIDGNTYNVGGLTGQPNYAFLRPNWIDQLKADPDALQFTGFEVADPVERIKWKRVRHHAPDVQWPPKGIHLRMDYRMPIAEEISATAAILNSDKGRRLLLADEFMELDPGWKVHESDAHERNSFQNEGKVGEIYTFANTCVYAERQLPKDTSLVELTLNVGTDQSSSWGPGITLVYPERTIKFYLRPGGDSNNNGKMLFAVCCFQEFF